MTIKHDTIRQNHHKNLILIMTGFCHHCINRLSGIISLCCFPIRHLSGCISEINACLSESSLVVSQFPLDLCQNLSFSCYNLTRYSHKHNQLQINDALYDFIAWLEYSTAKCCAFFLKFIQKQYNHIFFFRITVRKT